MNFLNDVLQEPPLLDESKIPQDVDEAMEKELLDEPKIFPDEVNDVIDKSPKDANKENVAEESKKKSPKSVSPRSLEAQQGPRPRSLQRLEDHTKTGDRDHAPATVKKDDLQGQYASLCWCRCKCPLCPFEAQVPMELSLHTRACHNKKVHLAKRLWYDGTVLTCGICSKKFRDEEAIKEHLRKRHKKRFQPYNDPGTQFNTTHLD